MDPLSGILAPDHVLGVSVRDVYCRLGQKKRVAHMILAFASLPRRFVRVTFWKVFPTIAVQRVTTMTSPVTRWTGHVGARRPITRSTAAWGSRAKTPR
jgi:hypothetical protein